MMNTTRRKFLRDASVTATGLAITSQLGAKKQEIRANTIECAPRQTFALLGTISTVQSGNWSDPATWGGKLPVTSDTPLISSGHTVTYDLTTASYAGVSISSGATLQFDSSKSTTLQSTGNVVVEGKLTMRPSSASVIQTLQFINIDESRFVGGGMDVLATDVGLWAMGSGVLDLVGTAKTAFVRAAGNIVSGATTISLNSTPSGWQAGDNISIAPTESPAIGSAYLSGFEDRSINSISGSTITLNSGTVRNHPQINNLWTAEIINLTRNVRIEGTATGRTHIFIRTSVPQTIQNIQIRYIGPRKNRTGDATPEFVLGRYGLHFHHCGNGSVGTIVQGCVIRDTGSHSYVPHSSNGITMKGNVAYNFMEIAFWWDVLDLTHGITWDSNIVAKGSFLHAAADIDNGDAPTFTVSAFLLGVGDDNVCNNNVAIGMTGDHRNGGGYFWQEGLIESVWEFKGNMAHNCVGGLVTWQNNLKLHVIEDSVLYNNEMGVYHGAYSNSYLYRGGYVYNSLITIKASSGNSLRVKFENLVIDAAGQDYAIVMEEGPLDGELPVMIRNCTITGHRKAGLVNQSPNAVKKVDIIQCTTSGTSGGFLALLASAVDYFLSPLAGTNEMIRVQPTSGQAYQLTKLGKVNIAPFAPTVWGNGNGLKGEYFNDASLSKAAFTRTDASVVFQDWNQLGVHYKITSGSYSIRWSGKIMPHYSEDHIFSVETGGGLRLYVDGKLILDSWKEQYPGTLRSSAINLVAGQKYDIKMEYFNTDNRSNIGLKWQSASLPVEYVPMDQLFSDPIGSQPPTPVNVPPVANAGSDITITLPTNSVTLDGAASRDADGTIVTYAWTKVAGPSQYSIVNAGVASPTVTGLAAGVYVFRLQVTDDKGATASDDVTVTVLAANLGPVSNAGADISITLPTNSTTLNGGASSDPDGTIVRYAWSKISGPSTFTIGNAATASTPLTNLVAGTYVFRLTVTDDKGATATDDVNVIVNNANTPVNKPPVAQAGTDIAITLPTNSVTLNGSASSDPDGTISRYAWSKVSGPTQFLIASPGSAITTVSNLVAGTYVFRLTVTDNSGATANDDITVVVNSTTSPGNQPPVAIPGNDITVQLPAASITLDGSASYDPDGKIISYKWVKVSGPTTFTLVTPNAATTELRNMVAGTYVFRLIVTDDKGAIDNETVSVTVMDLKQPDLGILSVVATPNPSATTFKLTIKSANTDSITIHIYDWSGKLVTSLFNVSNNTTVTVGAFWRAGLYTAVAWQGSLKAIVKLLKV
ncbi:T9SS type A sorting domain-containing protein [Niastella caeni]|uniref:T9SS type A sorting domain-containing protein n=1 Tax=Niastella caeni TaxID=2569763 RepID=A0A4S8HMA8_9BACT|nr:PKD domain-containing protein [Niastella caeni]THU34102.1 T9SS type A sorting domain-containing protein [Niastella caeni]